MIDYELLDYDLLTACHIMDWETTAYGWRCKDSKGNVLKINADEWSPSTNISQALEVYRAINPKNSLTITHSTNGYSTIILGDSTVRDNNIARGIVKAALYEASVLSQYREGLGYRCRCKL